MARYFAVVALIVTAGLVIFKGGSSESLDDQALPGAEIDRDSLVETITHGDAVDIESYLEEGEWTVVEFYADW